MLSANDKPSMPTSPNGNLLGGYKTKPQSQHIRPTAYLRKNYDMNPQSSLQHIWIVTGPAGSGKTTVAKNLQAEMGLPFLEGDDFHPASNREKMANGIPLTDADRWDWLISLRNAAVDILSRPSETTATTVDGTTTPPQGVIMSCSALKLKYRDVIRVAEYYNPSLRIHFIYLKADEKTLMERVNGRQSHYMKGNMVHSQFEALEDPSDEVDVLAVDVSAPPDVVQRNVLEVVKKKLAEYQ